MALMAAEEGILDPARGDLILFGNTSAEHPGTYDFAAECKRRLEGDYGLPFVWYEFCTVEDATKGEYRRKDSYRLVKPVPVEDDPMGYRSNGEVFEELLAFQGMLPNPHSRTCTVKLKLFPAHKLLADWLGGTEGPSHAGHYWVDPKDNSRGVSLVCPDRFADSYIANGGTAPKEHAHRRASHLSSLPPSRQRQRFREFTKAQIPDVLSPDSGPARPAAMRGHDAALHVRLLGLRADEPKRVSRVLTRCLFAEGATTPGCTVSTQPPGERPYFPLYDSGMDAASVRSFWDAQDFGLDIPDGAGNCTYCFMKGTANLLELAAAPDSRRVPGSPSDINWWANTEQRYMRVEPARNREGTTSFGFFGATDGSGTFVNLINGSANGLARYETGTPACDCTD